MLRLRLWTAGLLFIGLNLGPGALAFEALTDPPLFFTPQVSAIPEVLDAINGAKTSVHLMMYHLTETTIVDALIAAHGRGVDVQIILDQQQVAMEKPTGAFHTLTAASVNVVKSSGGFSLTHAKTFVIDGKIAYIMTLNLTKITSITRDVGYITRDPSTVQFLESLFTLDLKNAANQGMESPTTVPDNIVLSPVNSRAKLETLINSAKQNIELVVENFSDTVLVNDLIQAQAHGVNVQVLLPRCDLTSADFDLPVAQQLSAAGVNVRMMAAPMTATTPYLHQKSILVDGRTAFLGSENFSFNSLDHAREVGVLFTEPAQLKQMAEQFVTDFKSALAMSEAEAFKCPAKPFENVEEE